MVRILSIILLQLVAFPLMAQGNKELLSHRETAQQALAGGRYAEVEEWYRQLSRRDKNSATALRLWTLSAINSYKMELAEERLKAYLKLRLKADSDKRERDAVEAHYEKVERMLSNVRQVDTNDTLYAPTEVALQKLRAMTHHLGTVDKQSYTTPDGKSRWQIELDPDSIPLFRVYHQLGNGQWDMNNPDEVPVRGLPKGVQMSYPFLKGDGTTLYFSLEQPGIAPEQTLGGKDLYVSRYDSDERVLLVPTLLFMPFNSAANDYCYMTDEEQDLGWLLTDRGSEPGFVRLYTFTPSSLVRYDGAALEQVAMWSSPQLTPKKVRVQAMAEAKNTPTAKPYFWIGNRPIYSAEDLGRSGATVSLFGEFVKLQNAMEQMEQSLIQLREKLYNDKNLLRDEQTTGQILSLEESLESYRQRSVALRNELIRLSGNGAS